MIGFGDLQGHPSAASLGDSQGALDSYRRAVDLHAQAAGGRPNDLALQTSWGDAYVRLGQRQAASADTAGARHSFDEAGRIFDAVLRRNRSFNTALEGSATAASELSRLLQRAESKYREAVILAAKAVESGRLLAQAEPASADHRDSLADYLSQLGSAFIRTGEIQKAVDAHRRGVEIREQLVRGNPQNAKYRRMLMLASPR